MYYFPFKPKTHEELKTMTIKRYTEYEHDDCYKQEFKILPYPSMIDAANENNLTGTFIDSGDMEGSGGGYYSAFMRDNNGTIVQISSDIGLLAYHMYDIETENMVDQMFLRSLKIWVSGVKEFEFVNEHGKKEWKHVNGVVLLGSHNEMFFSSKKQRVITFDVSGIIWDVDEDYCSLPEVIHDIEIEVEEGTDIHEAIAYYLHNEYETYTVDFGIERV